MTLNLIDLTPAVREYMLTEIDADVASGKLYMSDNLNAEGVTRYPTFLRDAAERGSDATLQQALSVDNLFNTHQKPRAHPKTGTISTPKMASNAAQMLSEGEFNRFYLRGLCLYAIQNNLPTLEVYRARASSQPRPESERLIGSLHEPNAVLSDLRQNIGIETILGIPSGPNSGISLKIPSPPAAVSLGEISMSERFQELSYNFGDPQTGTLRGSASFQAQEFSQGNLKMWFACEVTNPAEAKAQLKEGARRLLQLALTALDAD